MNQMVNSDIKAISLGAIEQLNLDLLQCESKPFLILIIYLNHKELWKATLYNEKVSVANRERENDRNISKHFLLIPTNEK